MADVPKSVEEIARQSWGMAQRVGIQIAAKSQEQRAEAFAIAERSLRETATEMGISSEKMDAFIKLQMEAIRAWVMNIDVGGSPKGGTA